MKIAGSAVLLLALLSILGQLLWPLGPPGRTVDAPPLPAPAPVPMPAPDRGLPTREEATVVDAPGGRLSGLVIEPAVGGSNRPALVLVAGAGPARAADLVVAGRALAAQGLIVLVHDKRTIGYSPVHRDYAALAEDTRAALATVRARPGVAVDQVGLLGISEGGWVVPIAAAPSPGSSGPAFVVLVSAPVVSPGEQVQWLLDSGLAAQRAPLSARQTLAAALATDLPGGLLGYTRHVPEPALKAVQVPVLAVYGTQDAAIPVVDSAERLLAATGPATAVWMLAGADHGLVRANGQLAPEFAPGVAAWVRGLPGTAVPPPGATVRGAVATQAYPARTQPPNPLGGGALVLIGTALVVAGTLAGPLVNLFSGRGRPMVDERWSPVQRRTRWLGLGAVGGTLAINMGLGALAAVSAVGGGPIAAGGVWALMRGSGVLVAGLTVTAGLAGSAALAGGARPGRARLVGWVGSLIAGAASLVLSTRAGLFVPRW